MCRIFKVSPDWSQHVRDNMKVFTVVVQIALLQKKIAQLEHENADLKNRLTASKEEHSTMNQMMIRLQSRVTNLEHLRKSIFTSVQDVGAADEDVMAACLLPNEFLSGPNFSSAANLTAASPASRLYGSEATHQHQLSSVSATKNLITVTKHLSSSTSFPRVPPFPVRS